ncbi:MAG: hypothetical protein AAFR61_00285 [Bacteroidota bacterium]
MKHFLIFLLLPLAFSCRTGEMMVQEPSKKKEGSIAIKKVISIAPDFQFLDPRLSPSQAIEKQYQKRQGYLELLASSAQEAGVELEIYDPALKNNADAAYFNELLPLREKVFQVNKLQPVPLSIHRNHRGFNRFPLTFGMEKPILMESDFSYLAEKYGTPYFAVQGFYNLRFNRLFIPVHQSMMYHVLIDVTRGEIIYREIRVMPNGFKPEIVRPIFFDSYAILQNL